MRKIKFRGKRYDVEEWIYGQGVYVKEDVQVYIFKNMGDKYKGMKWSIKVMPETVGQYIGMKDKNGREIFEGDIVEFTGDYCKLKYVGQQVGLVVWHEYSLGFRFFVNNKYYHPIDETDEPETKIKVIGNKYQNPELLEVI